MSTKRSPETCEFRICQTGQSTAICRLAGSFFDGLTGTDEVAVSVDACEACSETFPPTLHDLNPVVASLVYEHAEQQLVHADLDAGKQKLCEAALSHAEKSFPIVLPSEDDLGPNIDRPATVSLDDLHALLPFKTATPSQPIRKWAVGVTTAPRRQPTLAKCLTSLVSAGWSAPHLFVDGDVSLPAEAKQLTRTVRRPGVGAWPNYVLSLAELLQREPAADAYVIIQDDALFPNGPVRKYLEQGLSLTENRSSVVSLYCCGDDQAATRGWHAYHERWKYGAVAVVYSPQAAREFLNSREVATKNGSSDKHRLAGIDDVIGHWLVATDRQMRCPSPSLVEHVGHVSSIWATSRAVGIRAAGQSVAGGVLET